MQKPKLILFILPLILSGCFNENIEQCKKLYNDSQKQPLALTYCQKAANDGDHSAQMILGKLLLTEEKIDLAINWLEKSAGTNSEARTLLGEIYETNKYGKKDLVSALFYYNKGCELGDIKACKQANVLDTGKEKTQPIKIKQSGDNKEKELLEKNRTIEIMKQKLSQEAKEKELLEKAHALEIMEQKLAQQAREKELLEKNQALEVMKQKLIQETKAKSDISSNHTSTLKFYNGLASFTENGLYGFVNKNGEVVIKPQFKYAGRFSKNRSAVQSSNGLWGFIDTKGNYIVYPEYCALAAFSESDGLAGVYKNGYKQGDKCIGGKWGFIDTSGSWVIPPILDHAERFIKGKAKVTYKNNTGYINRYGQWVN